MCFSIRRIRWRGFKSISAFPGFTSTTSFRFSPGKPTRDGTNLSCSVHYVLGAFPRNERKAYINCRVGPITVLKSQVMVLEDARKVFAHFLNNAELIQTLDLQDVTSMHLS